jgi:V8-like Glu-specific endopeptidase
MTSRASLPALALAVAGLVAVPAGAAADPDTATGDTTGDVTGAVTRVVAHDVPLTAELRRRILRYWTPDRMISAVPPLRSGPYPRPRRMTTHRPAGPARPAAAGALTESAPGPSASSRGAAWPAAGTVSTTTGKVFFTMDGRDYLCSASTVASTNRDTVVTAGHCAKNGTGAWAENWIFVPGYHDGAGPYGGFPARRMFVGTGWSGRGDDDHDVAMVALATSNGKPDGRHVADAAGTQAIGFGRPRGRQVYGFGYPTSGRYDGERLVYCSGRPHPDSHAGPAARTSGQGLRCDMTQGSSGGPWLAGFDTRRGTGTITSVSSFKYADDPGTMYGPYFGGAVRALYDRAQRG